MNTLHQYLKAAGAEAIPAGLPDFPMMLPGGGVPRKNQIEDLTALLRSNRFGLFSDAGTGKSLPMHAEILWHKALENRVLALLPPVLILQFVRDIHETFPGSADFLTTQDFTKGKAQRDKLIAEWDSEGTWPDVLLMSTAMFIKYTSLLKENGYDVVIVDEAQSLRGSESKAHRAVYDYTDKEDESILRLSTGTPVHNTVLDLYAHVNLLQRSEFFNIDTFKRRFCIREYDFIKVMKQTRRGPRSVNVRTEKIVGFKNLDELNKIVYKKASRVTKDEVLSLQPPVIIRQPVTMAPGHYRLYRTMLKQRMLEIEEEGILFTAELEVQLRQMLMKIVVAPQLFVAEGKKVENILMESLRTIRDAIPEDQKLLVYSYHNAASDAVADAFSEYNPAVIYGGRPNNAEEAERFKHDPDCRLLAGNPVSSGVGLNLQHVCSTVVVYEPWAVPGDFTQALARVWRSGQEEGVVCYLLEAQKTGFPAMIDTMLARNALAVEANGDPASFLKYMTGER